ncbi:MAG: uracil-DNA glycosylase, partial [Acidimicrobiia bacterium]|nr:uracil-DNA glycosylase [Acidimicrobiia bacterium]
MQAEARAAERQVKLEASWLRELAGEFDQSYMRELSAFLREQKAAGKRIYPPGGNIFNALDSTPFDAVKV